MPSQPTSRRFRPVLATVAVGAALFAAGCGAGGSAPATQAAPASTSASAAPASTAAPDATTWMDGVCGSALKFTEAAGKQPQIDTSSQAAATRGLSTYLGSVIAGVDGAIAGLGNAGPSPVAGGDEAVRRLNNALGGYRTSFAQSKSALDAADPNDPAALQTAIAPLQSLQNAPNPLADFESNPELDRAADRAPNCQKLSRSGQTVGGGATGGG